jgi:hypothetical protein
MSSVNMSKAYNPLLVKTHQAEQLLLARWPLRPLPEKMPGPYSAAIINSLTIRSRKNLQKKKVSLRDKL